jgi:hypothetical protein
VNRRTKRGKPQIEKSPRWSLVGFFFCMIKYSVSSNDYIDEQYSGLDIYGTETEWGFDDDSDSDECVEDSYDDEDEL